MKRSRRIASGALALVLLLTFCSVSAFAATDEQTATVQEWVDEGLLTGYEDGELHEDNIITRAEFIHLMNLIGFTGDASTVSYTYTDVETNAWYYEDIMSATAAGYASGRADGSFGPRDTVTQQEAIAMVVRAMGLELDAETGASENCSEWFAGEIGAAITAGLCEAGTDFKADLTRAEAVSLLDTVRDAVSEDSEETEETEEAEEAETGEDLTITKKSQEIDVDTVATLTISSKLGSASYTLDDLTITGDLVIESTGTITLDDVTVQGSIIIEGSGAKVVLKSSAEVSSIIFHDSGTVSGSSYKGTLESVTVDTDSKYDVVYINVDATTVTVASRAYVHISSDVTTLTVEEDAEYASIEITKSANIDTVNLEAEHVTLYGSGDIEQLNIDASYCTISKYLDIEDTDKASGIKGTSYKYIQDDEDEEDDDDWWYDWYLRDEKVPAEPDKGGAGSVTPETGTATVSVGGTVSLLTDSSVQNLTWSSSNTSVATVSAGTVTGVAPGTATITATDASGNTVKTWTVTVTGSNPQQQPAEGEQNADPATQQNGENLPPNDSTEQNGGSEDAAAAASENPSSDESGTDEGGSGESEEAAAA